MSALVLLAVTVILEILIFRIIIKSYAKINAENKQELYHFVQNLNKNIMSRNKSHINS